MTEVCKTCNTVLDENGSCPICGLGPGSKPARDSNLDDRIKHVNGSKPGSGSSDFDRSQLERTRPVRSNLESIRSTLKESDKEGPEDIDDVKELSPEDIQIDFNKIDSSSLFDDDFDDEPKAISSKMLPVVQKHKETQIKTRVMLEPRPTDNLSKRDLYAMPDRAAAQAENSKEVSYRTKGSVVKKKGQSIVILMAMTIILIIIIALYLTGFLQF